MGTWQSEIIKIGAHVNSLKPSRGNVQLTIQRLLATCLVSNFVGVAWRHLMLKRSMQHYSASVWTCTTTVLCSNKARYNILSQMWHTKLNRINVQIDDTQEYHGIPYTDGSYLVCSKKITVTSENFMILTEHSLKSKATTMSPRLSALPASIIKQQNSASSRIKREPLQVTGNPVEVAVVNTLLSICNNIPAVQHSLNQERCIEIRHTKLFVMCFQPSYHQIGSPRSH